GRRSSVPSVPAVEATDREIALYGFVIMLNVETAPGEDAKILKLGIEKPPGAAAAHILALPGLDREGEVALEPDLEGEGGVIQAPVDRVPAHQELAGRLGVLALIVHGPPKLGSLLHPPVCVMGLYLVLVMGERVPLGMLWVEDSVVAQDEEEWLAVTEPRLNA